MIEFKVSIQDVFLCSLERAFKTPMLCDVTKVHTGYGLMPKIIGVTDEHHWGREGGSKKVIAAPSLTFKGGVASTDKIYIRRENEYWKIEVCEFQSWMLGFYSFVGEWFTEELEENKIKVTYVYTLRADNGWLYPFNYAFSYFFWKKYMRNAMNNIKKLAYNEEAYLYE